jgi:hypothetical protein
MLLSARILNNVVDVNTFEVCMTLELTQGDAPTIYFALIDASVNKHKDPHGQRYVAPSDATLKVVLQDINTAVTLTKYATRPFPGDQSIWSISFNPVTDATSMASLLGTYALKLTLTEPGTTLPAAWSATTVYALDDLVSYSGGLFRSFQSLNLNNTPGEVAIWWVQMNTVNTKVISGFVSQAISIARSSPEF